MTQANQKDFFSVLDSLKTESRNPNTMNIDTMSTIDMVKVINNEDKTVAYTVEGILDSIALAVDGITERLSRGGRLLYFGAGTSGRLGVLDASECPPTYSTDPNLVVGVMAGGDIAIRHAQENIEDSVEIGRNDCKENNVTEKDVVVGIAASGRTPYVIGAVEYGREVGALTIGVSTNAKSTLNDCVDIILAAEVGPEVVTGSTRMKSGTAQKLILNLLSTGAMIKLGKTYSNLMVDFRPTNEKLRLRAPKIVCEVTGVTPDEARETLSRCNGETKIAILMVMTGLDAEAARELLNENGNVLAKAIKSHKQTSSKSPSPEETEKKIPVYAVADGGGTKTLVLIVDEQGNEVGQQTMASTNISSAPFDVVVSRLENGLVKAMQGRTDLYVKKLWCGLAGIGDPKKGEELRKRLEHLAPEVLVTPDINLISSALPKSTPECLLVCVIAGTGSAVLAQHPDGTMEICGGWGPVLGDQGSGFSIGTRALKAVSAAIENAGPQTMLVDEISKKWGVKTRIEFIRYIQSIPLDKQRLETAALTSIVFDCAYNHNDKVALEIATSECITLSNFVVSVVKRNNANAANIAVTGSVIVKSDPYRKLFLENIESQGVKVNILRPVSVPAVEAAEYLAKSVREAK
ncbi:hypothetical protein BB559_001805 [Furculomyces boomerangus]|uniref:N-acetyl-D-glucosamine kinase n=2 Tax=Harpellales TaxID=61421 RepID=A0A2T9Z0I2_9FUNG|nr:hypothetical protein BB559_001805 [Furculomyces boomerangus]PWA02845.1 hypothetical protein BB558_000996 [Smittium angustum]